MVASTVRRVRLRLTEVPAVLQDLVLAGVIGTLQASLVLGAGDAPLVAAAAAAEPLPLLLRRSHPIATIVVLGLVDAALFLGGAPPEAVGASLVVAAYSAGAALPHRPALVGLGCALVAQLAVSRLRSSEIGLVDVLGVWLVTAAAWWLGSTIRERRRYAAALEEQTAALQAARLELAEQAVAAERLRLARELHDVVAHNLTIIALHSSVGAHNAAQRPQDAVDALDSINRATRSALGELRALLTVLRDEAPDDRTLPVLADLPALAGSATAGVTVDLEVEGDVDSVPRAVGLSAYRIVQEALTNAVKHAAPTRVTVVVRADAGTVGISVRNGPSGGRTPAVPGAGAGLVGMRERVAAFGGDLSAGPTSDGGWAVEATLTYAEGVGP
jgi:signal transduction histidine kinase